MMAMANHGFIYKRTISFNKNKFNKNIFINKDLSSDYKLQKKITTGISIVKKN